MSTQHTIRVTFHRDDRDQAVHAGTVTFAGEDYDAFDAGAARERLLSDGRLAIGPTLVTFGGTIAPLDRIDRVVVEIEARSRSESRG